MDKLNITITSVREQVLFFFREVSFLPPHTKSTTALMDDQIARLVAGETQSTNAFRAAAIEYITELFFVQTGRFPNHAQLGRLTLVMDADFEHAQYKPKEEYPALTERQIRNRLAYETSSIHGEHIAADGQSYRPPNKYRGKSALD